MVSPAHLVIIKRYFGQNTSGCVASFDLRVFGIKQAKRFEKLVCRAEKAKITGRGQLYTEM